MLMPIFCERNKLSVWRQGFLCLLHDFCCIPIFLSNSLLVDILLHQWKTNSFRPANSPFVIDGKHIHLLLLFSLMAKNQRKWSENTPPNKNTCESCNQSVIKTEPVNRSLSLKICKSDMSVDHHFDNKNVRDYIQQTPNCSLIFSNCCWGKGLVNILAIWQCVLTYSSLIVLFKTCSLRKWNLIGICFVFEWITGYLEMLMALVLS